MTTRYEIQLTERQLRLVNQALEMFFRLQMGQFSVFADLVAFRNFSFAEKNSGWAEEFDNRIHLRDDFQNALQDIYSHIFRDLLLADSPFSRKTEDMECAIDIWEAIRYKLWQDAPDPKPHWSVDSTPPFHWHHDEPLIKISKMEEE